MQKDFKNRYGFTLIEMTIVLFIISLLILIIIPNVSKARKHAEDVHRDAMVSVVKSQVDNYLDDNGDQSVSYRSLTNGNYLTPQQVHKARDEEGIHIDNHNKVVVK